jgi:hypothetical protein
VLVGDLLGSSLNAGPPAHPQSAPSLGSHPRAQGDTSRCAASDARHKRAYDDTDKPAITRSPAILTAKPPVPSGADGASAVQADRPAWRNPSRLDEVHQVGARGPPPRRRPVAIPRLVEGLHRTLLARM